MAVAPINVNAERTWCSQHNMHPKDCFEKHNPIEEVAIGTLTEAELRQAIIDEHVRIQQENIRKQAEKLSRDPVELREKYRRQAG